MSEFKNYQPARIVTGKRWYVEFYQTDPVKNELTRVREYHNLNRIKDLDERMKKALYIVKDINDNLIPFGYPFTEKRNLPGFISVIDAVKLGMSIKARSDRDKTISSYRTVVNSFLKFCSENRYNQLPFKDFSQREAMMYMDDLTFHKKIKPRTFNNYRQFMTSIWNELKNRGYTQDNPWEKIKKLKTTEKTRRMLDDKEALAILNHTLNHDKMMALAILLLYYCAIRPGEQRQMKVKYIDLQKGLITLPGEITKNKKTETVTIPSDVIPLLRSIGIEQWYTNDFIFGEGMNPHPTIMAGVNTMNERHKAVIKLLQKKKLMGNATGVSIYSWKDTGAMALIKAGVDPYQIMKHFRHSDLNTTQKYMKSLHDVNEGIRSFKGSLLPRLLDNQHHGSPQNQK